MTNKTEKSKEITRYSYIQGCTGTDYKLNPFPIDWITYRF